jgi:spore germination protein
MDKKKVIKWTTGILVNLAALVGIYLTANPQVLSKPTKQDSLDKALAARFVPSYRKSADSGLLSKVVNDIKDRTLADQRVRAMRNRKMTREDTIVNRKKLPIHLVQQHYFEEEFADLKEEMLFVDKKSTFGSTDYNERDWDILNNTRTSGGLTTKFTLKPDVHVFGWHPYWMGSAYKSYNFTLLSTLAYYGAEVEPATGEIKDDHGWESAKQITQLASDTAKGYACRVELTVINNGEDNNRNLLSYSGVRGTLINNLTARVTEYGDGICIDFEGMPLSMRDSLTKFVSELRDSLNATARYVESSLDRYFDGYTITMVLPCFDWTGAYDVEKLAPLVDRFVVTGYDYYGSFSKTTGPVAPLTSGLKWNAPNIDTSVHTYLSKGIPKNKLLLGLPYYGVSWQTIRDSIPADSITFLSFHLYRDLRNKMALERISYDTASVSAYFISGGPIPVQYWFDNQQTLSEKYRWILRNRLGGVGIWALGYDNGYPDLWQSLRENFASNWLGEDTTYRTLFPAAAHDTLPLPQDKEWGIVAANGHYLIFDNPYVLLYGTLGIFALILLLQVILDQQPFNELWSKRLLLFIAISLAGTAAIIFLGLALWSRVPHREVYLLLAGIIGGYLLFRLTQRIVGKKERLP